MGKEVTAQRVCSFLEGCWGVVVVVGGGFSRVIVMKDEAPPHEITCSFCAAGPQSDALQKISRQTLKRNLWPLWFFLHSRQTYVFDSLAR